MKIMIIFWLGLVKESATFTVEMQQDGNPFLGSNNVQLSCIVKAEDDEIVDRILILSRLSGTNFKNVILFDIQKNITYIINPGGSYLTGRVTLKNLISSENRTVVEYHNITCEDNADYRCDVLLSDYNTVTSPVHPIKVKGTPNKPDGIPVRIPDFTVCTGIHVNYSCSGMVGAPPGYFRWTKLSNVSTTMYNETFQRDIPRECNINRTSILSIEIQKEDNNAIYRCEIIHEIATTDMFQKTLPEMFVYDHSKDISVDKTFAESTAGIVTITVLSTVGVLIASVVLFKTIKKARHLQTLKTNDEKDTDKNHAEKDKEATNDHIYTGLQY